MKIKYNPWLKEKARWLRNNMTLSEVLLWNQIKGGQMLGLDFHRQKPILNYIVDFYCSELKLIIEIDGFSHDFKMDKDNTRDRELNKLGLKILRFQDVEIKSNLENVLRIIYDWIVQHPPTPLIRGDCHEPTNPS